MRPVLAAVGLMCALVVPALAQNPPDTTRSAQDSTLRVFFDCPNFDRGCDFDFMRTEIGFVNWVRNREDADVHILISTQQTGGGGDDYTITFIGLKRFRGTTDTLHYISNTTDTRDEIRKGLAHVLKLGLIRFVATTPLSSRIEVSYSAPAAAQTSAAVHDPWNYWVFRISLNGSYQVQKTNNDFSAFTNVSARRVTERWKVSIGLSGGYQESNVHFRQDSVTAFTFRALNRNYGGNVLVARSLGSHWSAGLTGSVTHATFVNQAHQIRITPAIEYDFFPYSQSTRGLMTLRYAIGVNQADYIDTTVYDKTSEALPIQTLTLSVSATQPWGTISASAQGSTFLRSGTINKNSLTFFGSTSLRLVRGLNVNFFGFASIVHDQLFLPKGGADEVTVLLKRRQFETSFFYQAFFGLSYSFGSIYNNIVNPRFEGGGGGVFFID